MHDDDFRSLLGIASGVLQFQKAFKAIQQSVSLVSKHPDQEHIKLLAEHVSVFAEAPMIDLFLGFLADDMRSNSKRVTPISKSALDRAQRLTAGVIVDDREVIPDDITF